MISSMNRICNTDILLPIFPFGSLRNIILFSELLLILITLTIVHKKLWYTKNYGNHSELSTIDELERIDKKYFCAKQEHFQKEIVITTNCFSDKVID